MDSERRDNVGLGFGERAGGITAEDMPAVHRELFRAALEAARLKHDPADDWEAFAAAAWREAAFVLELGDVES